MSEDHTGRTGSYDHRIVGLGELGQWFYERYKLLWTVTTRIKSGDAKPVHYKRYTNTKGAVKFAKKWGLKVPRRPLDVSGL